MNSREYTTFTGISSIAGMGILSVVAATNITPYPSAEKSSSNIVPTKTDFLIDKIYSLPNRTWSNVVTAVESSPTDNIDDISIGLNIINKLAFIEGDSEVEKIADNYFDSVNFTTKKVIIK